MHKSCTNSLHCKTDTEVYHSGCLSNSAFLIAYRNRFAVRHFVRPPFVKFIAIAVWLCTWPAHFLTGRAIFVQGTSCRAISSREVTKEQTANLYHRNFTSAGYSASSVEKYHYPSDCHRRNMGNLLLIPGVLAVLQCRSHGVPDKVAKIIRIKVLVNDLFSCQNTSERADLFVVRN